MEHSDFMHHLRQAHSIEPKGMKGKRSMLMHLDGDTWFSWSYEWEINGLKFVQNTCNKRSPEDAAYWK